MHNMLRSGEKKKCIFAYGLGRQRVRWVNGSCPFQKGNKENYALYITNDVIYDHIVRRVFTSSLQLQSKNRNNIADAIACYVLGGALVFSYGYDRPGAVVWDGRGFFF